MIFLYLIVQEHGVATDCKELQPTPPPDMVYPINGKTQLFIPGCLREDAAEILFQQVVFVDKHMIFDM